ALRHHQRKAGSILRMRRSQKPGHLLREIPAAQSPDVDVDAAARETEVFANLLLRNRGGILKSLRVHAAWDYFYGPAARIGVGRIGEENLPRPLGQHHESIGASQQPSFHSLGPAIQCSS